MRKSYFWLLRCKDKHSIDNLKKGCIRFSAPKFWHQYGHGQNDMYDGAIAVISDRNKHIIRDCENIKEFFFNNQTIIYDKRIDDVPCICFYGITTNSSVIKIPKQFFDDFSSFNRDEYRYSLRML